MRVVVPRSYEAIERVAVDLSEAAYVSYDVETQADEGSNLEDWHPSSRIVCSSFTWADRLDDEEPNTAVVPLAHPVSPWFDPDDPKRDGGWIEVLTDLVDAMSGCKLIAQNPKYDVRWTYAMTGTPLEDDIFFDPAAASYALDENEPKALGALAEQYLGVPSWKGMANLKQADREEWKTLAHYNALDTINTFRLVLPLIDALKKDKRVARIFHHILMPITKELVKVERIGMPINLTMLDGRIEWSIEQLDVAHHNLMIYVEKFLGEVDPADVNWNANSKFFKRFMEKSGAPVYEHSPKTGQPSWNRNVLKRLAIEGAAYVQYLLSYREHEKDLGYMHAWQAHAQRDGRIHPTFNPLRRVDDEDRMRGTVTGRLSSERPNAQQIPKRIKTVYTAPDDWLFIEADYSQIELRIGAMVFKEPNMLAAYERGADLHTEFAAARTGKSPEDVTDEERFYAKAGNFGFLYGMGSGGFVNYAFNTYGVEVSMQEAQQIRQDFFGRWSKLEEGHDRITELARRNGYAVSPFGRIRRVPEIHSSNEYLRARAERQAINSVVQSAASDLMLLTIIDLGEILDPSHARIMGTVHDSILLEIRRDKVQSTLTHVSEVMLTPDTKRRFGTEVTVPLAVEFTIGRRWADEKAKVVKVGG